MELLRGHDDDPAVARTQVEHLFARLQTAKLEHLLDDGLGRGIVRRQLFGVPALRPERGTTEGCEPAESSYHRHLHRTVINLPLLAPAGHVERTCRGAAPRSFPPHLWKILWKCGPDRLRTVVQQGTCYILHRSSATGNSAAGTPSRCFPSVLQYELSSLGGSQRATCSKAPPIGQQSLERQ